MLGPATSATTAPNTIWSTRSRSSGVRSISSLTQCAARSRVDSVRNDVPDFRNGVRRPPTITARRPWSAALPRAITATSLACAGARGLRFTGGRPAIFADVGAGPAIGVSADARLVPTGRRRRTRDHVFARIAWKLAVAGCSWWR